ncbi:MAG: bifunctional phosphoribosylaminoimidazolecarboxamide formyltransferase/IMP cyclohydrolase [Solirubrobacteraceae bacterium]|nr:bifunctional phosphoribosylaminoimidazolecarboxamide formyltransferase/IMP cyclohydrolase [Solirubrobacteraceae bacterium]
MSSEAEAPTPPETIRVKRALLSVFDKRGIVDFARGLAELGVELVSTGGTLASLEKAGLEVRSVDDLTGFPEMMDGRLKTLHPKLHGGLLGVRDNPAHAASAEEHEIEWIDLVCVNLYPFEQTASRLDLADSSVIEQIDVGGPTMIRAAAKNHAYVSVVVSPESYDGVLAELEATDGEISYDTRRALAGEAFHTTARYDTSIAKWFSEQAGAQFPDLYVRAFEKTMELPYGENPHQRAAYYTQVGSRTHALSMVQQHQGKQLSYNNLLDLDSARRLVAELADPACAIVKHNNPCGAALGGAGYEAYERAFNCDPLSAFGGIVALNREVDEEIAKQVITRFTEVVIAPTFSPAALEVFGTKPNLRVLEDRERRFRRGIDPETRDLGGGMLMQDRDTDPDDRSQFEVATERHPTDAEWDELLFAWRVVRHVKSNAIVLTKDRATVGIGAGQMSRVDSVRLALDKSRVDTLDGAVLASDAFFPFADGPELAIDSGVRAIIQPGGSVRDDEVIEAANKRGVTMVFTDRRHFRH